MLISLSLDFRNTDLATRERFHLSPEEVTRLYREPATALVADVFLLSTCNRVELYAWSDARDEAGIAAALSDLAGRWTGSDTLAAELLTRATHRSGSAAARHLLQVAAGLESQVQGDSQILAQVRAAYGEGAAHGRLGGHLHRLLQTALRIGKQVQQETGLGRPRRTIGAEAARFAASHWGDLETRRCVVIGAGKTAGQAARQMARLGMGDIVICNRTPARAQRLAQEVRGRPAILAALHEEVARADIAILATSTARPLLLSGALAALRFLTRRSDAPLLVVDVSVPRNAEPEIAGLPGVTLVNLDTLKTGLEKESVPSSAVTAAEGIVAQGLEEWEEWLEEVRLRKTLDPLRRVLIAIARQEVAFVASDDQAEHAAERIVAKFLAHPMTALRTARTRPDLAELAMAVRALLGPSGGHAPEAAPKVSVEEE